MPRYQEMEIEIVLSDDDLQALNEGGSIERDDNCYVEVGGMEVEVPIRVIVTREPKRVTP